MVSKSLLILSLAAASFASPAPQETTDFASLAASFTEFLGTAINSAEASSLGFDGSSLASELSAATGIANILTDIPTLPDSIYSVLATAVPTSDLDSPDYACSVTAAPWYNDLPGDVKSALTSYGSELESWASKHSSELGAFTSGVSVPVCTGGAATGQGSGASNSAAATGSSGSASPNESGATSAGSSGGSSGSSSGGSASGSAAAAPRVTGAVMGSFAGVVGALGVMAIL